jgi:primosomal protein N' (replication factor Y)
MDIQQQPSEDVNIDRLKAIKEIRDIRPELTPELIQLSKWF